MGRGFTYAERMKHVPNRIKQQYKPLFWHLFNQISKAPDWHSIDRKEKGRRLEQAFSKQRRKYRQPPYEEGDSLFEDAVTSLELPD